MNVRTISGHQEKEFIPIRAGTYLPECLNEPAAAFLAVEKSVSFCRKRKELTTWKSD